MIFSTIRYQLVFFNVLVEEKKNIEHFSFSSTKHIKKKKQNHHCPGFIIMIIEKS